LPYAIPAKAMITFSKHNGVHKWAPADGAHEVVIIGCHIIQQPEIDRRIQVV
jgi:hypothetical protein